MFQMLLVLTTVMDVQGTLNLKSVLAFDFVVRSVVECLSVFVENSSPAVTLCWF
eukprot:SAG31_NODE_3300_length_4443_cov_3.762431_5_plen_54_part_00